MAFADDLRGFLENLLLDYDPSIDLSTGSPAQTRLIDPIVSRFAEDPFSVDIATFIRDRLVQEYPELAADNGGELEDILSNPLQLLLEPFKREIELIKLNQSVRNAGQMSDDEADALGENFFEERDAGDYAGGLVRLYFAAPTTSNVTTDKRLYTNSGLNFYPSENFKITSDQMLFNRQGNLYYLDITVQAEEPGEAYNVDKNEIANIDDVPGVIKVANLSRFTSGNPREDNETYLGRIPTALTERSLVTERGVSARVSSLFTSVRALSVVGAGDSGMDRDVLKGTGEGFLHITASASYYGSWLFVSSIVYRDTGAFGDIVIQAGDVVRFRPNPGTAIHEAKIAQVIPAADLASSSAYLLILEDTIQGVTSPSSGYCAIFKPGFITISEVPGGISTETEVPDGQVHLGGHTDVFVRPNSDTESQTSLSNITDDTPVLAIPGDAPTNLNIAGTNIAPTSIVSSAAIDFVAAGVKAGDVLVIETSAVAGSYRILKVGDPNANSLRLDTLFTQTVSQLRARIIREVHIDLIEPKIPKLPFNTGSVSDLRTTVGSTLFRLDSVNIQSFGASVGDTIRILDGTDAGDYTITAFDNVLGGQGPIVDRAAGASNANLRYEVFTPSAGLSIPLVRLKSIEVLDSTNQGTGITVPYGDAVDVRPTCDFEGAGKEIRVLDKQLFVLPDGTGTLSALAADPATPGANVDARYTQEIQSADGIVRKITTPNGGNPITTFEVNLPPFLYNGKRNKLLAFTTRKDPNFTAFAGNNRTSDVAEAKIGDSITILDGPNQGSYVITDHRVIDAWSISDTGHHKIAIIEVDPPLPVDPVKTMLDLIATVTPGSAFTGADVFKIFQYAVDFFNASGFWALLQTRLQAAMAALTVTITNNALDTLTRSLAFSGYSVGPSAKGELRCFFQEPVSLQFSTKTNPTRFEDLVQSSRVFRLDPLLPPAQVLPESETATSPSEWNRNASMQYYANGGSPNDYLFLSTGSSFVKRDIEDGDIVEFYPAINDMPVRDRMSSSWVCVTQAGSNVVTLLAPKVPGHRTKLETGQLFFIDSGPDTGAYVITQVIQDDYTLGMIPDRPVLQFRIDKTLTHSTLGVPGNLDLSPTARPAMSSTFSVGSAQYSGGQNKIYNAAFAGAPAVPNVDWITIYAVTSTGVAQLGEDVAYLGTFKIIAQGTDGGGDFVAIDRTTPFPVGTVSVFWILHGAPDTAPIDTSLGGTLISDQYVRCRMYASVPEQRFVRIPWDIGKPLEDHTPGTPSVGELQIELKTKTGTAAPFVASTGNWLALNNQAFYSHMSPYRVIREGAFKISSTAMSANRDGALYYVDVPVVGYGPQAEMNIPETAALGIKENAIIKGYRLVVENKVFTFSDKEQVSIVLPSTILPVGSTPGIENEISLSGQTIEITYNNAPLVEELQRFFDSPLDRIVVANYLVRHFLPAYVYLDAAYVGGSDTNTVAKDLISYINTIPPATNKLVASVVQDKITNRGASKVTLPITLIALVHDIDRKIRGLRSQDTIGAGDVPVFNGTYAQTYFIAGPDTSNESPRPNGEQVFLVRT